MDWKWDDYSFELTAKVLAIINPLLLSMRGGGTVEGLADWMKSETQWYLGKCGYWGMGGFYVSVCPQAGNPDGFYGMASLAPYGVTEYLKQLENQF